MPAKSKRPRKRAQAAVPDKPVWLTDDLVLGWKVTKGFEPEHWKEPSAKPGEHTLADVVRSSPRTIAHHTVVIAQSGSGKSFFLGRLVEEIALKTSSRVLVFDPNSDFRMIARPKPSTFWTAAEQRYDRDTRRGFLADEPKRANFASRWKTISTRLHGHKSRGDGRLRALQLDWLDFPVDVLADEAGAEHRDKLRHCHSFVNILAKLAWSTRNKKWLARGAFIKNALKMCEATAVADENKRRDALRLEFGTTRQRAPAIKPRHDIAVTPGATPHIELRGERPFLRELYSRGRRVAGKNLEATYAVALTHRQFFNDKTVEVYFDRAAELERSRFLNPKIEESFGEPDPCRIEVVDLPSLPDALHQKLAISTFLEAEWTRARDEWDKALGKSHEEDTRVPTFIVVEEAHNLISEKARTPIEIKLQEQFRRVAAEGRKLGLFLILISQRPDKLDRMVMSECENRAIMRVGSTFILRTTCEILGLEGVMPRMTEKVLDFDLGRALLVGPWVADEPAFLVSAARRTMEGGRDLRWQHWARPEARTLAAYARSTAAKRGTTTAQTVSRRRRP